MTKSSRVRLCRKTRLQSQRSEGPKEKALGCGLVNLSLVLTKSVPSKIKPEVEEEIETVPSSSTSEARP